MVLETESNIGMLGGSKCLLRTLGAQQSTLVSQCSRLAPTEATTSGFGANLRLPAAIETFIREKQQLCKPARVYLCDGSEQERTALIHQMYADGAISKLHKYVNCWLVRTDPADVARVESKTFISTSDRNATVPNTANNVSKLVNWIAPEALGANLAGKFTGCMAGRTMYVIVFRMGAEGPFAKYGIQLTDSPYVVLSMGIMTTIGVTVLDQLVKERLPFVRALHSVGVPLPTNVEIRHHWPCNPEQTIIAHFPDTLEIASFGSGYGGNSLLGKKCLALRLGSVMGYREGWLAEHMLILSIKHVKTGRKHYVCAAFPSACGKTNLAMLQPTIPDYEIECLGDDIAWLRVDEATGQLMAMNPEKGFFGVAPGTSMTTNPHAMATVTRNTIFTNVAETDTGDFYWEGLEQEKLNDNVKITDWQGQPWTPGCGRKAAHPNSRFCAPASQCPIIAEEWQQPEGVPISAILFGGRRSTGVPLVLESLNWSHGVYLGAAMRSESTAAAEHKEKQLMHDPFAMRPFFGYNFGKYLQHWLSFQRRTAKLSGKQLSLPKIYHVNWFRKSTVNGAYLWPGYGENARVLDWICKRLDARCDATETPVGLIPKSDDLNLDGLTEPVDFEQLFAIDKQFWLDECDDISKYFIENVGSDLPKEIRVQLEMQRQKLSAMSDN